MKTEETIEKRQRISEEGLEGRPNPNPHFHYDEDTWDVYSEWESNNPNSDRYQKFIWDHSQQLKELNILRFWERTNLLTNWSPNYQSITELYINKVLEEENEKVFGDWKDQESYYEPFVSKGWGFFYKWYIHNLKIDPFTTFDKDKESHILTIVVDYILVRKGLRPPKTRLGKLGYTYDFIEEVEQLYERWINS